ncbi:MAG: hypothetical protein ABI650_06530 [Dokdonella sp.]
MSHDILTAEQYRNKRRLSAWLDRTRDQRGTIEHAQRAAVGVGVITRLLTHFRARIDARDRDLPPARY